MGLEQAVDRLPDVVCRIPELALELFRAQKDKNQHPCGRTRCPRLVLQTLQSDTRFPHRHRCLNAIDNMIELELGAKSEWI